MTYEDLTNPELYAAMSEEELKAHIQKLRKILDQKQGRRPLPGGEFLGRLLDPKNKDFLGTGLTLAEYVAAGYARDFQSNLVNQPVEERRRRLDLIVELSVELYEIKKKTHFATRLAAGAIEDVIKGDWEMVREHAEYFIFEGESPELREMEGPIYLEFSRICQKAFDTRPEAQEVQAPEKN